MREWIEPKTDWEYPDAINYWDYNRIRSNLLYLNDKANEFFPPSETLDLGNEKALGENFYAREINAFEQALERLNYRGYRYDLGTTKTFTQLGKMIDDEEKNRLEKGCLRLYQMFKQIESGRRTAFRVKSDTFTDAIRGTVKALPVAEETWYTGGLQKARFVGFDKDYMTMSGSTEARDAGEYEVSFTLADGYKWWDGTTETKTAKWVISKAQLDVPTMTSPVEYTGEDITVEISKHSNFVAVSGVTTAKDAGEYTVVFTISDVSNCEWTDGTIANKEVKWVITAKPIEVPYLVNKEMAYTGQGVTVEVSEYDADLVSVSGTSGTSAGDYVATFSLKDKNNYTWTDGTTEGKTDEWSIVAYIGEASGDIVTVTDALAHKADALEVGVDAVQSGSGDPYPAGGGKNLLDPNSYNAKGVAYSGDGDSFVVTDDGSTYGWGRLEFPLTDLIAKYGRDLYVSCDSFVGTKSLVRLNVEYIRNGTSSFFTILQTSSATGYADYLLSDAIPSDADTVILHVRPVNQQENDPTATVTVKGLRICASHNQPYTPYSNIRPITAYGEANVTRCGKNLIHLKEKKYSSKGITAKTSDDLTYITIDGTQESGTVTWFDLVGASETDRLNSNNMSLKEGYSYKLTGAVENICYLDVRAYPEIYGENEVVLLSNSLINNVFTLDRDYKYIWIVLHTYPNIEVNNLAIYPMLRLAEIQDNTYEPYTSNTYQITFPDGQIGRGAVDFTKGELTVTHWFYEFDGTEEIKTTSQGKKVFTRPVWKNLPQPKVNTVNSDENISDIVCSHFTCMKGSQVQTSKNGIDITRWVGTDYDNTDIDFSGALFTQDTFKTYLADQKNAGTPVQIVYELETPQTLALTAQEIQMLEGTNTVYADCGTIELLRYYQKH